MKIFLHIGLHKTGTTFLQQNVFPKLDNSMCLYNPNELLTPLMHALILQDLGELNQNDIVLLEKTIRNMLKNIHSQKVVLLSNELMSQNMFSLNYSERAKLLGRLFPNAEIILFLRYQTSWLNSVYRQALQEGEVLSVKEFFGFNNKKGLIDLFKLNWTEMVKTYQEVFGKEKTHIFFYEDLRDKRNKCISAICELIGQQVPTISSFKPVNRSYSALACLFTIKLYQIAGFFHLKSLLPNRNDFLKYMRRVIRSSTFPEKDGTYISIREDFLDWNFVKNNFNREKIISIFLRKLIRRIRFFSIWRFLMQEVLDRIVYIDWDIFEKENIKKVVDNHFHEQNKKLSVLLYPKELPIEYLKYK